MKTIAFACLALSCLFLLTHCNNSETKTTSTAVTPASETGNSEVTGNWKIGVQMWTFRMFTFAEAIDKVDSAGAKNIEAFWGQPLGAGMPDSFGIRMSDDSRSKVKQLLQTKGITKEAMVVISPGSREESQQALELAMGLGLN